MVEELWVIRLMSVTSCVDKFCRTAPNWWWGLLRRFPIGAGRRRRGRKFPFDECQVLGDRIGVGEARGYRGCRKCIGAKLASYCMGEVIF